MLEDIKAVIRDQDAKEVAKDILGLCALILMVFAFAFLMIGLVSSNVVPV